MLDLPYYISLLFIITTILTVWFLYRASSKSNVVLMVMIIWLIIQAALSFKGFYTVTNTFPPRFLLMVLPPVILIILLFVTKPGKAFIDKLNVSYLTLLHIVRIPVEIVLFLLFLNAAVPELMTFEGRNFDILSGISAGIIFLLMIKQKATPGLMIAWNIICLLLLINIVVNAVLSAPSPFQKFAFDQPNIGVLYFPFNWLPSFIVPVVLFAHLVSLRHFLIKK